MKKGCKKTCFEGINRGIFGIPSTKKSEIESLVKQLESLNPTPFPTLELEKVTSSLPHWHLGAFVIRGKKRLCTELVLHIHPITNQGNHMCSKFIDFYNNYLVNDTNDDL